jgi:hypothetical protein
VALTERRRLLKSDDLSSTKRDMVIEPPNRVLADGTTPSNIKAYAWQITRSQETRWPEGRAERDVGGPFGTVRSWYDISHSKRRFSSTCDSGWYHGVYQGKLVLATALLNGLWFTANPTYERLCDEASRTQMGADLVPLGTKLIASSVPTNPVVDGSVGLAELFREGIPSMIGSTLLKSRVGFLRGLGSEYLNFEFGWKPLVSDVKNAAKAIVESETILKQLVRDSGKNVRRRRHLPATKETAVTINNGGMPIGCQDSRWFGPSWTRITDTYRRDTWFSGCYTFEYDPGNLNNVSKIATQARLLYGLQLTPEVLWNLAPWSWLVDWFANVGPLLHNVSAFQNDQLVLRYGYVMDRHQRSYAVVMNAKPIGGNSLPDLYNERYQVDWKNRIQATPYGFGVASSSFTIRQWAILAALGITRAPRVL